MAIIRSCDLCKILDKVETPATYDAKTYSGPWAYVCDNHLASHCVPNYQLRTKLSTARGVD